MTIDVVSKITCRPRCRMNLLSCLHPVRVSAEMSHAISISMALCVHSVWKPFMPAGMSHDFGPSMQISLSTLPLPLIPWPIEFTVTISRPHGLRSMRTSETLCWEGFGRPMNFEEFDYHATFFSASTLRKQNWASLFLWRRW